MKILNAIIENYKAIKRVEITPKGHITIISGNNSQGKSSAIEALVSTLAGEERGKDAPIRRGTDGSIIEIDLGDRIVKRIIKGDRDELEVYTKDGFVVKRPRSTLNELIDKRKFDVMKFISGSPKEQRALLMELAGLSFDEIDKNKNVVYNDRTMIGRERDSLKGQLEGLPVIADAPAELVDTQALLRQIQENNEHNNAIKSSQLNLQAQKDKRSMLEIEITQLQEKLKMLQSQFVMAESSIAEMEKAIADFSVKDNTELQAKLNDAENLNNKYRAKIKRDEVMAAYQAKENEYTAKTAELEKIEQNKIETLKNAKFPISGLSLSDDGVLFNDIPLEDESLSNRIKIAMSIAMAIPTELRSIILDDGETLDDDNIKLIEEMLSRNDYQLIIARRTEPGDDVITIKEGIVL